MKRIKFNKRAETESSIILDGIQLLLGALVFLFIIFLLTLVMQYFWPPPDTDFIAINSIANTIEFGLQKVPLNVGTAYADMTAHTLSAQKLTWELSPTDLPVLTYNIPLQLKKDSYIEFVPPNFEKNDGMLLCLVQDTIRKSCRKLNAFKIAQIQTSGNVLRDFDEMSDYYILKPKDEGVQNLNVAIYRDATAVSDTKNYIVSLSFSQSKLSEPIEISDDDMLQQIASALNSRISGESLALGETTTFSLPLRLTVGTQLIFSSTLSTSSVNPPMVEYAQTTTTLKHKSGLTLARKTVKFTSDDSTGPYTKDRYTNPNSIVLLPDASIQNNKQLLFTVSRATAGIVPEYNVDISVVN